MDDTPESGSNWTHKREGYKVTVAELHYDVIRSKGTGEVPWHRAVAYTVDGGDTEEGDNHLLIRTVSDFLDKFVLTSDFSEAAD
jgi:hypothetical protein